jgi:choline dehydrogenase-like flavoprotein
MLDALREVVQRLFPTDLLEDTAVNVPGDAVHEVGTSRMGADPRTSVVDRDGRVHGVAGVVVVDGGVLPYQSAKNPTLTMMAIASRCAHALIRSLRSSAS